MAYEPGTLEAYEAEQERLLKESQQKASKARSRGSGINTGPTTKGIYKPTPQPLITRMSDVQAQDVSWLWYPYIPLGKLTLLEGDPGLGKTFICLALVAAITRGYPLLGQSGLPESELEPGNALYMSAEDGLADTLRPRLDSAGADVSRVHALTGWQSEENGKILEGAVSLKDIVVLEEAFRAIKPLLVIIDPLQAYLGANVNMNQANEVRPLLTALSQLAERYGSAIVCIRHLSKAIGNKALYAGLGSIDFTAASRSVLSVGEHNGERLLAHVKSSLAPQGKSIRYELRDGTLNWLGVSDVTAEELRASKPGEAESTVDAAQTFLRNFLEDGPRPSKEIDAEAKREGISHATLRRAKKELGVVSRRENTSGGDRGDGSWVCSLPDWIKTN